MVEKLEAAKLKKYKFGKDDIERLTTWDKHEMYFLSNDDVFWASNIEKAIYSGPDAERKYYFRKDGTHFPQKNLNLVPEYYSLKETGYLKKQKKIAGSLFKKQPAQEDFKNLEMQETEELINNLKAHKMYDRLASKKEYVEKLNWYLKWLNSQEFKNEEEERIDWIKIFNDIDVDKKLEPRAYKVTNLQDKQNYFSGASFRTTVELLQDFKKKIYLLSNKRKLAYINSLNVEPPQMGKSESELFNQTVFEARYNLYDFLLIYKAHLDGALTPGKAAVQNKTNKIDLLHNRLSAVAYFAPMEGNGVKVPMFTNTSNDEFRAIVKEELNEIRAAEAEGNKRVPNPYKSRDIMYLERVFEISPNNLISLFNEKFDEAKALGFKTTSRYAKHELKDLELHYKASMGWFPLFEQWKDLLKEIAETGVIPKADRPKTKQAVAVESKSKKQGYSLRQIAIAYCVLGIVINKNNAANILKMHSNHNSTQKLIQKRINKMKTLITASDNKTANTKFLNDLAAAKRLISGTKNAKAKTEVTRIITEFQAASDLKR